MNLKSKLPALASLPLLAALLAPAVLGQEDPNKNAVGRVDHAKVTTLLGADIKNKANENLGDIQDLVFNKDGRISYVVVSFGGFLGMGDKYFAMPWETLKAGPGNDFTVDLDKDRLEKAPGFDKKNWPNMADASWTTEVDRYYTTRTAPDRSWGGKAATLKNAEIRNATGAKLGMVEDIIVDLDRGRATLVIVHTEKSVEPKDSWIALPWSSLNVVAKDNVFGLNGSESTLAQAPNFGKDKWPVMDRAYTIQVYRYFGRDLDVDNTTVLPIDKACCCRSTRMVGSTCRTATNEELGIVKDVVLSSEHGRVMFLVLDTPAADGQFRAIPWSLCRFTKAGDCVITCDAATVKSAPTFKEDAWPDFDDAKWQEKILTHFGVKDEHIYSSSR